MTGMTVIVNGEQRRITEKTLEGLLTELGLDPRAVVVELNRVIVRRPALAGTALKEGDAIELVHFVGGG